MLAFLVLWWSYVDAGAFGEKFERFAKLQIFRAHHEAEDVPAVIADPALKRLTLRIYLKTRAAVVVPRADADEIASLPAQLHIAAYQIDDVDSLADLLFGIECGAKAHGRILSVALRS